MRTAKVANMKHSHLDGTVLHSGGVVLDSLTRPSLLITDSYNSKVIHPARKDRYAAMFGKIAISTHPIKVKLLTFSYF